MSRSPKPRASIVEYQVALDDPNKAHDEYSRDDDYEKVYRRSQEDFYKRHPEPIFLTRSV